MHLNQLSKYIDVIGKGIPTSVELIAQKKYYGTEELNIAYGLYEKHFSIIKLINNIKQIWLRN
tara:strand:- start:55 stop:243 length:189 start_codon:yes stop_codon:yes gene_type:complete